MRKIVMAALAGSTIAVMPNVAFAAQHTNYDTEYCTYSAGNLVGSGTNYLNNGVLEAGWCADGSKLSTVTVEYRKTGGSAVTVEFGYRWVDYNFWTDVLSNKSSVHWDGSANDWVTISAGEIWGARFNRNPAEAPPNGQDCIQGAMHTSAGEVYYTQAICR